MSKKLKKYRVIETIHVCYEVEAENSAQAKQAYSDYVGDDKKGYERFKELIDDAICGSSGDLEAQEIDENGDAI